ncbi:hypothetical protein CYMTET_31017, partial [Cymbomonas tetramitiformis]
NLVSCVTPTNARDGSAGETAPRASAVNLSRRSLVSTTFAVFGSGPLLSRESAASTLSSTDYDAFADNYDVLNDAVGNDVLGFTELRAELLTRADGDVLEVGIGTGLNLPLYSAQKLDTLVGFDLSQGMLEKAAARSARMPFASQITLVQGDVAILPFEDGTFDHVVDTFSLCVFPDPAQALAEMARVLRPSGTLLLVEHNQSPNPLLAAYQNMTAEVVASVSKGCRYNQDVTRLVKEAGMRVISVKPALGGLITSIEAELA